MKNRRKLLTILVLAGLASLGPVVMPVQAEVKVDGQTSTAAIYVGNEEKEGIVTASNNTLTITNSAVGGAVAGSTISQSDLSAGTAITSPDAETIGTGMTETVTGNTLTLNDTTEGDSPLISKWLAGGLAMTKTVDQNKVTVNLPDAQKVNYLVGVQGDMIGGFTVIGNATKNIVTLNGVTEFGGTYSDHFVSSLYGGYSYTGTVSDNVVNIDGGKFGGTVYGGAQGLVDGQYGLPQSMSNYFSGYVEDLTFTSTGDVMNNSVTISGGGYNISAGVGNGGTVYGGLIEANLPTAGNTTRFGDVHDNKVEISGTGMANNVYGGAFITYLDTGNTDTLQMGSVTNNHVDILSGGYGHVVAGGYYAIGGTTDADLEYNSVTVNNGTVGKNLYGAYLNKVGEYTGTGTVANNSVLMTNGTMDADNYASTVQVYGGYADGGEGDNVTVRDNTTTIQQSTIGANYEYHQVEIGGGHSDYFNTEHNSLTLSDSNVYAYSSVYDNAYIVLSGGDGWNDNNNQPSKGSVTNNTANITNNLIQTTGGNNEDSDLTIVLAGGVNGEYVGPWTGIKDSTNNTLNASGNTIGAASESVPGSKNYIAGGIAAGQSLVYDNNDGWIPGDLVPVKATGNTATLTNNTIGTTKADNNYVAGGMVTVDGDAESNSLTITGGAIEGNFSYVAGGYTAKGTAGSNTLQVSGGTIGTVQGSKPFVAGGYTASGDATDNTAILSGVSIGTLNGIDSYTAGGYSGKAGKAAGNSLTVLNSSIGIENGTKAYVAGGYAGAGDATDNTLTISGGTIGTGNKAYVAGGYAGKGNANNNTLTVFCGTIGTGNQAYVAGGLADKSGNANNNTLNLSGVTIGTNSAEGYVAGGYANKGDDTGNTVTISGGTFGSSENTETKETTDITKFVNYIAGGYAGTGDASDNTVNLQGDALKTTYSLYGGLGTTSTDNTLNVSNLNNSVSNLDYFQNLNFFVPKGSRAGDTLLTVTDTATITNAAVTAKLLARTPLNPGEFITLLRDENGIDMDGITYNMAADSAETIDAGFVTRPAVIEKQGTTALVITPVDATIGTLSPDTKLIAESRAAAVSTLFNGADFAATDGFAGAVAAYQEEHGLKGAFAPFVAMGGYNLRADTGSYVDTNGINTDIGFVRQNYGRNHTDTIMPFVEYGNGNYTSHLDDGARGDGNQRYVGAGLLVRRDQADGLHYEGMLRAGRLNGDFKGSIEGYRANYDSSAAYVGAMAGLGKRIPAGKTSSYDFYGKFFWNHLASDSVQLHSDIGTAQYDFDTIDSYRTRLGFRWTENTDKTTSYYAGLAWNYEFGGDAKARYRTFDTPSPSTKGSSALLELGWQSKITRDNPWGADIRFTGWAGTQRGVTYSATVSRAF